MNPMSLKPPHFWDQPNSYSGYALEPLSWLYRGGGAIHKYFSKPYRTSIPVISIGNIIMGGAGKTPVTIAIAKALNDVGLTPHIISRGYGGSISGPVQVDIGKHQSHQVGDEPLLLAKYAPTWVSRDRKAAAQLAIEYGADVLLLDDAHQNYSLERDIRIVVVNEFQGFGNGRVFPAGPLRQSIKTGLKEATAAIYITDNNERLPSTLKSIPCPLIFAKTVPIQPNPCGVLAFSGIGYPEKFRQTLLSFGYEVKEFTSFPDHYPYTEEDMAKLRGRAHEHRLPLITTEKDALRIPIESRKDVLVLDVELVFNPPEALVELLLEQLKRVKISV